GLQRAEDRFELGLDRARLDRRDDLDPVVEVPRQQVGAAEEVPRLAVRIEDEETAVLEEAPQDAPDGDVLAHPLDAGTDPADAPDDDLDLRAGIRRPVERLDHLGVVDAVHLDLDSRILP